MINIMMGGIKLGSLIPPRLARPRGMSRDLIYRLLDLSLYRVANKCRCHFESKGDLT
jgi:hypothetical protein